MEFLPRPSGTNPHDLGLYRHLMVGLWLREFRYSSAALLGQLVDIAGPYNGQLWRFLNNMKQRGWVQDFSNEVTPKVGRLFMPGSELAAFLEAHGQEHSGILTNPVFVRRAKTAYHDLALQYVVLQLRGGDSDKFLRIDSENQLQGDFGWLKPDVLVTTRDGRRVAIEYELTRKANLRIYHTYSSHLNAIRQGLYSGVRYVFPSQKLCDTYLSLFYASSWPNTGRLADGRITSSGPAYNPDSILTSTAPRSRLFYFAVEPYLLRL